MDHVLIVNASAGSAEQDAVAAAADVLRAVGDVEVVTTADVDALDTVLGRRDGRRAVVCGGDGSLHLAVSRLRALGAPDEPLGLIPLGTGNDLARGVGLPFDDPAAAAERVRDGSPHPMDLLLDDTGRICVNALHAGVGADASARAAALKDRLAAVAYPVGAVLAGLAADGLRTEVVVDGRVLVDEEVLLVAVTNGTCFGGGATVCPHASPDDGQLDVVAVTAVGPLARAGFALALTAGEHLERDDVHVAAGREVRIRAAASDAQDSLRYVVDGELHEEPEPDRTWRVEHHGWTLVR